MKSKPEFKVKRFRDFVSSFFARKKKKREEPEPGLGKNSADSSLSLRQRLLERAVVLPSHLNQTFEVMRRSDLYFEEANCETGKEFEGAVEVLLGEFGKKLEGKGVGFEFVRESWIGLDKRVDFLLKFRGGEEFEVMVECKYSGKEGDGVYLEGFVDEACGQLERYYGAQEKKSDLMVCLVNFKLWDGKPYLMKGEVLVINMHAFSYLLFVILGEMERG